MHKSRYILLNCAVICVLAVLGLRLFHLQVVKRNVHEGIAHGNALRDIRVLPARGSIYDRNGVLLVHNVPKYTITLIPKYFDQTRVPVLTKHLGIPDSVVVSHLQTAKKQNPYRPSPVSSNVSFEQYSQVIEDSHLLPGVGTEVKLRRNYATGTRASHALGYIGEISRKELDALRTESDTALYRQGDLLGKTGIERGYEPWLRGVPGIARRWINNNGLEVMPYAQGRADIEPREYYDVHLALDSRVQHLAESLFVNKRGAVVALDPDDGSIIALVSKPDYSLELFSDGIRGEDWNSLTDNKEKPMYNRATMNLMPPGSTWKPFMALFGLSEGLLGEHGTDATIYCGGYHPVGGGRIFRCLGAHGHITVLEAIQTSCNTFFFELGRRMNLSAFKEFANRFGFGLEAPTDIREQTSGLIPDSDYFDRTRDYWSQSSLMNLGIGQGDMGVTPLQLARYASALANGGTLHPPYLVSHLIQPETGVRISPDLPELVHLEIDSTYMNLVRRGMRLVMEEGTGVMAQIPGIPSAGKTGTAQAPGDRVDHSVFIMFAPFDNPQIAIAVQCENTGDGSQCAAPIASLLAEQYLKGEISPSWQTDIRMKRAMSAQSQSLIPESE